MGYIFQHMKNIRMLTAALLVAVTLLVLVQASTFNIPTTSAASTATWDPSLGWDFECHTNTHPSFTGSSTSTPPLTDAQIIAELQAVNAAFQAHGYPPPQHMAYPYGDYNSHVETIVAQYRKSARTVSDDMTAYPISNWYELNAAQFLPTTTMTDVTNWVTQCINTKSLLIIFTHDISNSPSAYGCTPTQLTNLLNYLVQQQNAGKIVVMTMAQAYDAWHNASNNPTPTVVVAFDDANESDYLVAYPLFAARGLKGTSYIVTSYVDGDAELHWTEIATMRSHTVNYNVHLESKQTSGATTNLGTIAFSNKTYTIPTNFLAKGGYYQAQYYPTNGYTFDHWETTGALTMTSITTNPTTVTLNSNGTLRAVYKNSSSTPYTFTDGFESGNFNAWSGTSTSSGETLSIVSSPVHSGTKSAKFTSNGGGNGEYAITYKNVNLNEAYIKASFQITAGLPEINNGDHFYLLGLTGTGNQVYAGIIRTNGVDRWTIHVMNGTNWLNWVTNTTAPLPTTGKWITILLHWKESSTNGTVELYINGAKTLAITNLNTASYGNTTRIALCITYSYVQKSVTLYADDAAISNTPITP